MRIQKLESTNVLRICLTIFILTISKISHSKEQEVIKLASTEWCPYICKDSLEGRGIVFDYVTYLLENSQYSLEINILPWSRAIREAQSNRMHGLLTATPIEAPELTFTSVPTMNYRMCFFTSHRNSWRYESELSLSLVNIAIINDYGYGEPLDTYIRDNNSSNLMPLSGNNSLDRLITLLKQGRVDAFIEDEYVVNAQIKQGLDYPIKNAGCLDSVPFYIAFTPEFAERTGIIQFLNKQLASSDNMAYLTNTIIPKYLNASN